MYYVPSVVKAGGVGCAGGQGMTAAQVDQFEAEIESLVGTAGKKKKGKTEADARSEECQVSTEPPSARFIPPSTLPPAGVGGEAPRAHPEAGDTPQDAR